MFQLGLIGKTLKHSYSATYFAEKFRTENIQGIDYTLWEMENIEQVLALKEIPSLIGFNVTIPYKESIIPFLYRLDPVAQKIGAVNCVTVEDHKWIGYNTDCIGFRNSLLPYLKNHHKSALILGNGGAAKAIEYVMVELNIPYRVVGRSGQFDIPFHTMNQSMLLEYDIIINCTPIGMFPNVDESPLSLKWKTHPNQICYDLIYQPSRTKFLEMAVINGSTAINGLEMLRIQAEESWQIWRPLCEY